MALLTYTKTGLCQRCKKYTLDPSGLKPGTSYMEASTLLLRPPGSNLQCWKLSLMIKVCCSTKQHTLSEHGKSNSTAKTGRGIVARSSGSSPYTSTICHFSGTPRLWRYWNRNVSHMSTFSGILYVQHSTECFTGRFSHDATTGTVTWKFYTIDSY